MSHQNNNHVSPSLPIQPLYKDEHGTLRFRENKVVTWLLDNGGKDLNDIARLRESFGQDDMEQFSQLIGYSLSGFGELSYVRDKTYETAKIMFENGITKDQAEVKVLNEKLNAVRAGVKEFIPNIFRIHPDDLEE